MIKIRLLNVLSCEQVLLHRQAPLLHHTFELICAIWPEVMTKCINAYATVETKKDENYGQIFLDQQSSTPNSVTCIDLDSDLFKTYLFNSLLKQ